MLLAGLRFLDAPVVGLQTGGELARTKQAVIDAATLEIVAYELDGPLLDHTPALLRVKDVREFSDIGIIVDSSDEFVRPEDIIKLKEIFDRQFSVDGMLVTDEKRKKLGRVSGYTVETNGFVIQQLSVKRPLLKSFSETELLIHRTQIIEINDRAIVVHSKAETPEPLINSVRSAYINPFRKNQHSPSNHTELREK